MKSEASRITSRLLWEVHAIEVSDKGPFTLASGNRGPVYADCRRLISFPAARAVVISLAHKVIQDEQIKLDVVAGGESAGIPFGAWLSDRLSLPFIYVRKKPKGYGRNAQIEGVLEPGQTVLLFEDMITDGGSKVTFIKAIREAGGAIDTCLVILDRKQGGREALAEAGVTLYALTNLETTLAVGREDNLVNEKQLRSVEGYLSDPEAWHRALGFTYTAET
jgi:orotate phosphoribosyltransferase